MIQRYTWKEFQKLVIEKMFPDAERLMVMLDYDSSDGGVQETYQYPDFIDVKFKEDEEKEND